MGFDSEGKVFELGSKAGEVMTEVLCPPAEGVWEMEGEEEENLRGDESVGC